MFNPIKSILIQGIKSDIKKVIKEGRLIFLNKYQLHYTDKKGNGKTYSFNEFAIYTYNSEHTQERQALGITPDDVKKLLVELSLKQLTKKQEVASG